MAVSFAGWEQVIEDISTRTEFQNATVVIYQPGVPGEYDVDTGVTTWESEPALQYRGQARVVGLRSSRSDDGNFDPTSLKPVRIQVQREGITGRVLNNCKAYFTDGGRNPQLLSYVFNVNSDFNSSHVAAYTFELTVDLDAADTAPPQFDTDGDWIDPDA